MARLGFVLMCLFLSGFVNVASTVTEWERWSSEDKKFSLEHPKGWNKQQLNLGEIVTFAAPKANEQDTMQDLITLITLPNPGDADYKRLEKFMKRLHLPLYKVEIGEVGEVGGMIYNRTTLTHKNSQILMYMLMRGSDEYWLIVRAKNKTPEENTAFGSRVLKSVLIN